MATPLVVPGQMTSDGFTMNYGKEYHQSHSFLPEREPGSGLSDTRICKGYGHGASGSYARKSVYCLDSNLMQRRLS